MLQSVADSLLRSLAESDLDRVAAACSEHVVMFGTDADEEWSDRGGLLAGLEPFIGSGMAAEWDDDPVIGGDWVAGTAVYTLPDGSRVRVRVSMVFADGLLVHGHFSVPVEQKLVADKYEP
jgi:hypothetical protein